MSRPNQLPPRCPIAKKLSLNPIAETYNSSTQDSKLENQPTWLDELLHEKTDVMMLPPPPLRRSASDSIVVLRDNNEESLNSEAWCELESASCVYGPNSPRSKNNSNFSNNNTIASAFSDYNTSKSIINCSSVGEHAKRNPGQRSRVRKLQHIAELERTVAMLQEVESDLSMRVASLLQTRATLSLENSHLKQKMAILKQDKLIREGEYHLLKNEAQRLKSRLSNNRLFRSYSTGSSITPRTTSSHLDWKLLDLTKLNLN